MAETTQLTVLIVGRSYPLIVEKAEEQNVLLTVKAMNERITQLQAQFQSKDKQDCLAMTFLEFAIKQPPQQSKSQDVSSVETSLSNLEQAIDKLLA